MEDSSYIKHQIAGSESAENDLYHIYKSIIAKLYWWFSKLDWIDSCAALCESSIDKLFRKNYLNIHLILL